MFSLTCRISVVVFCAMIQAAWAVEDPEPATDLKMQILDLVFKVEDIGGAYRRPH